MFLDLYDEETDEPAQCHTSNINEELGLVTHLLTDKTGIDKGSRKKNSKWHGH